MINSNRLMLKKLFCQLLPSKEGKITSESFVKLASEMKVAPSLVSVLEVKRLVSSQKLISYGDFEELITKLASLCFKVSVPQEEKIWMLFVHTRNSLKMLYQVNLITHAKKKKQKKVKENTLNLCNPDFFTISDRLDPIIETNEHYLNHVWNLKQNMFQRLFDQERIFHAWKKLVQKH